MNHPSDDSPAGDSPAGDSPTGDSCTGDSCTGDAPIDDSFVETIREALHREASALTLKQEERLRAARHHALRYLREDRQSKSRFTWFPMALPLAFPVRLLGRVFLVRWSFPVATLASVTAAVVLFSLLASGPNGSPPQPLIIEDVELLTAAEDLDLYEELDFYQWLDGLEESG